MYRCQMSNEGCNGMAFYALSLTDYGPLSPRPVAYTVPRSVELIRVSVASCTSILSHDSMHGGRRPALWCSAPLPARGSLRHMGSGAGHFGSWNPTIWCPICNLDTLTVVL